MPTTLNGTEYYRTAEVCAMAGTSRNTFLRWVRQGLFTDVAHRDRKGWRLFTEDDVARLRDEVSKVHSVYSVNPAQNMAGPKLRRANKDDTS